MISVGYPSTAIKVPLLKSIFNSLSVVLNFKKHTAWYAVICNMIWHDITYDRKMKWKNEVPWWNSNIYLSALAGWLVWCEGNIGFNRNLTDGNLIKNFIVFMARKILLRKGSERWILDELQYFNTFLTEYCTKKCMSYKNELFTFFYCNTSTSLCTSGFVAFQWKKNTWNL